MTQFATPAIQYVGQDDGEGADKGEAADDHVDRVAGVRVQGLRRVT